MKTQAGLNSEEEGQIGKGHCNHPRGVQLLLRCGVSFQLAIL